MDGLLKDLENNKFKRAKIFSETIAKYDIIDDGSEELSLNSTNDSDKSWGDFEKDENEDIIQCADGGMDAESPESDNEDSDSSGLDMSMQMIGNYVNDIKQKIQKTSTPMIEINQQINTPSSRPKTLVDKKLLPTLNGLTPIAAFKPILKSKSKNPYKIVDIVRERNLIEKLQFEKTDKEKEKTETAGEKSKKRKKDQEPVLDLTILDNYEERDFKKLCQNFKKNQKVLTSKKDKPLENNNNEIIDSSVNIPKENDKLDKNPKKDPTKVTHEANKENLETEKNNFPIFTKLTEKTPNKDTAESTKKTAIENIHVEKASPSKEIDKQLQKEFLRGKFDSSRFKHASAKSHSIHEMFNEKQPVKKSNDILFQMCLDLRNKRLNKNSNHPD